MECKPETVGVISVYSAQRWTDDVENLTNQPTFRTLQENSTLMNLSFRCRSLETSANGAAASGMSRFCETHEKQKKLLTENIYQAAILSTLTVNTVYVFSWQFPMIKTLWIPKVKQQPLTLNPGDFKLNSDHSPALPHPASLPALT